MRRPAFHLSTALVVCLTAAAPAAAQAPPDETWRTLETAHFRVTFPARLKALARRAGDLAERAHGELTARFRPGPSGPIDIVLTDHVDASNGLARFWPSNRIVLFARPPPDDLALGYFDDRLAQLITHELAHVFHLDYGGPFGRIVRGLFGRSPAAFPGAAVPGWVIEGLATWYESALTGAGRVHGTFHETMLRTAALEERFEGIGRAGGDSPQWPAGSRRYVYGSLFFEYLLDKHGHDRMAAFVEGLVRPAVQTRLWEAPINGAGKHAFGVSLSSEWEAWAAEMRVLADRLDEDLQRFGPVTEPETLTRGARQGLHPSVTLDGRSLIYLRSDGRSDPRLVAAPPAGGALRTLTRTNHVTPFDVLPGGGAVFAQLDFTDRYRAFSDLYVLTPAGAVRRVTEGARLTAPAAGPGGSWAIAVAEGDGMTGLARVGLGDGAVETLVAAEEGTFWAYPAVSPDGRWIAATRWSGRRHDVVILAADGRVAHEVTRDRALDMAPAWTSAGDYLVWTSDRTGILNILGVEVDPRTGAPGPPLLLTNVRTGAAFPSVDPAGEWLYFSGYHVDGWEVERAPFAPASARRAPAPAPRFAEAERGAPAAPAAPAASSASAAADGRDSPVAPAAPATSSASAVPAAPDSSVEFGTSIAPDKAGTSAGTGETAAAGTLAAPGNPPPAPGGEPIQTAPDGGDARVRDYDPVETLRPTYWEPSLRLPVATAPVTLGDVEVPRTEILGYALGGRTSGFDLVGRHAYDVGGLLFAAGGKGAGDVRYEYRGFGNPVLGMRASQSWDDDGVRVRRPAAGVRGAPETFFVLERERRVAASLSVARPRVRTFVGLTLSAGLVRSDRQVLDARLRPTDRYRLGRPGATLSEVVASLHVSTARSHAFQMGSARGVELYLHARTRRDLDVPASLAGSPWFDRSADDLTGGLRAYLPLPGPGFAAPVLAVRASGGAARGPGTHTGFFDVGGGPVFFPVRGYRTSTRSGRRAWAASVELRVPLALVNRGLGAWPLHLDRIFGSVFLDGGDAWGVGVPSTSAGRPRPRPLRSAGFEITTDLLAFYAPLRVRTGVAFRQVGLKGRTVYVELGVPF